MKRLSAILLALFLLSCVSFARQGKKTEGKVTDAGALLKVHTFCLDTSELTPDQSGDLKRFLKDASKRKGLFANLNWERVESCSSADATVELTMREHQETVPAGNGATVAMTGSSQDTSNLMKMSRVSQATMLITSAPGLTLYQVEGAERDNRVTALASPFLKLSKDLKTLSK